MHNSGSVHCSRDPQTPLFSNFFIKNGFHDIIHIFKNYFVTVFLVFSKIICIQTDPLSLYFPPSSCFLFLFFFFSFPSPSYIFIFFFSFSFILFFFFYLSLIMGSDFGFAILVVILGKFFHYMDGDFGAFH